MEEAKIVVSVIAVLISLASLFIAFRANARAKKAEEIKNLLGEKETVAFGALKLLQDGFPKEAHDRKLLISALLQASLFTGSDRARALLFRVIEVNRPSLKSEMQTSLQAVEDTFSGMEKYSFTTEELDLSRGRMRLGALRRVING